MKTFYSFRLYIIRWNLSKYFFSPTLNRLHNGWFLLNCKSILAFYGYLVDLQVGLFHRNQVYLCCFYFDLVIVLDLNLNSNFATFQIFSLSTNFRKYALFSFTNFILSQLINCQLFIVFYSNKRHWRYKLCSAFLSLRC